jgi:ABC-type molybdate transport system substrate-binding protein
VGLSKKGRNIMNRKITILTLAFVVFSVIGCATAPPSETVFVKNYKHRVVRVVPVTHHKVTTVKVHHVGSLTKAERSDLVRWYKNKHHRPHHRVNVVFVRN